MAMMLKWSMQKLVQLICDVLQNRFDFFLAIEGNRGLGKSTLAYHLAKKVKSEMRRRGVKKDYYFHPHKCLLYERKEVLNFFNRRKVTGIADEMINVSFNRDFYNEDQKDLIKMINMNRDHNNFFIACVPTFATLDSQIKNLCRMRITVIRRGFAIIQTPTKTIYGKDVWDQAVNEKIERKWLEKKVKNPHYRKLTTFRGAISFPKLNDKEEAVYQKVKDNKRNLIAKGKGLDDEVEVTPFDFVYNALVEGKIKDMSMLEGVGLAQGFDNEDNLKRKLRNRLRKEDKDIAIVKYLFSPKLNKKAKEIAETFK